MLKDEFIGELLEKTYNYEGKLCVAQDDVKKVDKYYSNNFKKFNNVEDFMKSDEQIEEILSKMPSGKFEINHQLADNKGLQKGILTECVILQTIAEMLGLHSVFDCENTPKSQWPVETIPFGDRLTTESGSPRKARYCYYEPNNCKLIIAQCGGPEQCDGIVMRHGAEVVLEIKDTLALINDVDVEYDESGKLLVSDKIKNDFPSYANYINDFNSETNIKERLGSNYKLGCGHMGKKAREKVFKEYLDASKADLFFINGKDSDELIALRSSDLGHIFKDGTFLINTCGSEIRTCGKNHYNPFTPNFLNDVLKESNIQVIDDVCHVSKTNSTILGKAKARGKAEGECSRLKINNCFFVRFSSLEETDDEYIFNLNKIRQCKAGISIHISLGASRQKIKEELYCKRNINAIKKGYSSSKLFTFFSKIKERLFTPPMCSDCCNNYAA